MSNAPPGFEKQLESYLADVEQANSEATIAFLFLEFSRNMFKQINMDYLAKLFPVMEKYLVTKSNTLVVKGRVDAFLGNLIVEFKKNLDSKRLDEAQAELQRYVSILWSKQKTRRIPYVTIATDGIRFVSYRPRTNAEGAITPDEVYLDQLDRIDFRNTRAGTIFVWLDRYMLMKTLKTASTEAFSIEFGLNRPAFREVKHF